MDELQEANFSRIYRINWLICGPLLVLFGWPYYLLISPDAEQSIALAGSFFFSLTFTLTIIHGHIAVALGALHMDVYYEWHKKSARFPKIPFHPVLFTTRFRLTSFLVSVGIFMFSKLV
ncbi:MAG: hypothetical protein JJU41_00660 [Bacteroidetes bacterium]|nr:hypothetical protein [Bacteroidota bacterium]MCH8523777.1 hypothetical protein [Balneolales bacterium]